VAAFWTADGGYRIFRDQVLSVQVGKKTFESGYSPGVAAMGKLSAATVLEILMDSFVVYLRKALKRSRMLQKKREKEVDITVIGADSIVCKPFLSN